MKKYQIINNYEDKIERIFDTEKEANDYISSKKCLDDKYSVNVIDSVKTSNKSILLSIKPEWVAKILNGEKTIEVRKQFPKDYKGWVYIYCTKSKQKFLNSWFDTGKYVVDIDKVYNTEFCKNGKVVARFWCDNVGIIKCHNCLSIPTMAYTTFVSNKYYSDTDLQTASCLNGNELMWYLGTKKEEVGYAIHISKLEIFDEPKELSEF